VAKARVRIRYDPTNEAHVFLYGTTNIVRTLGDDEDEEPEKIGANEYEIFWDGRDDTDANRLLLGGKFTVDVSVELDEPGGATGVSAGVDMQIAEPHSGHFCGDWPRSSVYDVSPIPGGRTVKFFSDQPDENANDTIYPTHNDEYDEDEDGFWWKLTMKFEYKSTPHMWVVYTTNSWSLDKGTNGSAIPKAKKDVILTVTDAKYSGSYPTQRVAFIARYNGTDYDVYRSKSFWSSNGYVDTHLNISAGDPAKWFPFDGAEPEGVELRLTHSNQPPVGAQVKWQYWCSPRRRNMGCTTGARSRTTW